MLWINLAPHIVLSAKPQIRQSKPQAQKTKLNRDFAQKVLNAYNDLQLKTLQITLHLNYVNFNFVNKP